ncbi:GlcG/HbpS family heme-binding protein [Bradyrhizobium sp. JR3.5]
MQKLGRLMVLISLVSLTLQPHAATAQFLDKKVLTLAAAEKIVAAAKAEAERNRLAGVIAVVDDGGWPILLLRMDNAAYVASVELAPGKARTAALFKKGRLKRSRMQSIRVVLQRLLRAISPK